MHVATHAQVRALALTALVSVTGCTTNSLRRTDSDEDAREQKTLIVEMKTRFGEGGDLFSAALHLSSFGVLSEVGQDALPKIQSALAELGFASALDDERGAALREETFLGEGVPTVISGMWVHPSTAYLSEYNPLIGRTFRAPPADVAERAGKDSPFTHFAFITLEFFDASVLGFGVIRWPAAVLRVVVVDADGEVVLDAVTAGKGATGMFLPDRSRAGLMVAVDEAITLLGRLEAKPL